MPSSDTPNINIIALAADDDLWVAQTDLPGLQSILANPAQFVHDHVSINGQPGVLVLPFVVVFHKVAAKPGSPDVLVQGINHTSLLTVKYADNLRAEPGEDSILPPTETHEIMNHGDSYYSHLQMTDRTPAQVANSIVRTITAPEDHFDEINALPQTLNGQEVAEADKVQFQPHPDIPHQFIYQGNTPLNVDLVASNDVKVTVGGDPPFTCVVSMGNCDVNGNVIVNGILLKSYTTLPGG